jgi:hypothetical protein
MRHHNQLWNLLALCLTLGYALPALAQRTVSFGFDSPSDLSGWTLMEGGGDITWHSSDASSSSSSGSVEFRNCCGSSLVVQMSRCIPVSSPTSVTMSMRWRRDGPVPNDSMVFVFHRAFADSACSVNGQDGVFLDIPANSKPTGQWHTETTTASTGSFSAGSVIVFAGSNRREQAGFMYSYLDDIQFTFAGEDLPGGVSIDGAGSGFPGALLYLEATGTNCSPSEPLFGWNWSAPGATIHGYTDRNTIVLSWDTPGTRSVSVSHPACGSASASKQVVIDPGGPHVQLWPNASYLYQPAGTTLGATAYFMNNYGEQATTITLEADGPFFTQSPGTITLAPGAWKRIEVKGKNVAEGLHRDRTFFSGPGLTQFLIANGQLIQLLVFATEPADGEAKPDRNRVDVTGEASSVTFRNTGSLPLEAQVIATKPWIVPDEDRITIPAGGSMPVGFTIDRSLRPDADDPFGSVTGEIGLQYSTTAAASKVSGLTPSQTGGTVTASLATVIDTVAPPASAGVIPPLGSGEVALFVPGVGHVAGSVGTFISDLSMVNLTRGDTLGSLKLYFNPLPGSAGTGSQSASIASLAPNKPIALADLVGTVFKQGAQLGSLQIRSSAIDSVGVAATVFNSSDPAGTFGTTVPVVRSDRGAGPGEKTWMAGLRSDETHHTNLFIQEMTGSAVTVRTDFLGSAGNTVGTRTDTVPGFALIQLGNVVPEGAVSAALTNTGPAGQFFAYATPVDRASGDTWAVSDWPRQFGYSRSEAAVIPVAGALRGANNTFFRTDLVIMNTGSGQASGTLRSLDRTGPVIDRQISLAPSETKVYDDVTRTLFGLTDATVGHMTWTPAAGEVVITSRNFTTIEGDVATFGSGVPTVARSASLVPGAVIRFGGIEDSTLQTVGEGRPASFRTNFGIVETAGSAATVRVTVRYEVASGLASERAHAWTELDVPANGFILASNLVRSVLGEDRDQFLGDLRNVEVDFEVAGGEGRVLVFTSSVDNGTGDSILRSE